MAMEFSRTEYPALLTSLQPDQAIVVLNDRVALINKINSDIADWLQERRRVEETYAAGLRKLARRPQQDGAAALGIFQMPWQRIVSGTENLAQAHETLAGKIESDIENPLRQFASRNREMQALGTTHGNLAAIAKEWSHAQKKAEKLNAKGSRKADGASSSADDAAHQWESQAPYVFEQLQALDERRINHLRDVLTQLQTHELDQIEKSRASAESCLNALLNLETADEIKTFAAKVSEGGRGSLARRRSSATASARPPSSSLQAPPTPPPPRLAADRQSQRSGSGPAQDWLPPLPEQTPHKAKLGGLKRLGTVMSRRKSAVVPEVPQHPSEKKKKERTRSFAPFRRGDSSRSFHDLEDSGHGLTPTISEEPHAVSGHETYPQIYEAPGGHPPRESQHADTEPTLLPLTNGTAQPQPRGEPAPAAADSLPGHPGMLDSASQNQISTGPLSGAGPLSQQPTGPTPLDPITRAMHEASLTSHDAEEASRNLKIRDQPIQEDESAAQQAMSNMANQLRIQAQTSGINRVQGSVRGRRDVRHTMFIPTTLDTSAPPPGSPGARATTGTGGTATLASPIQRPAVPGILHEDHTLGSDTTSVHSSRSLATVAHHPDLHEPGLNASIIETINTWFTDGGVSKSFVVGEIALAYNPSTGTEPDHETIRLQNFQVLEKVAANPMFVAAVKSGGEAVAEDQAGTYDVALSAIRKSTPTVGLKYQLHIDDTNIAHYSPVLVTPAWQIVEGQANVIVLYSLNPAFSNEGHGTSVTLKNVVVSVHLDVTGDQAGKATSAMMAPTQGASFRRKASSVVWRFHELTVKSEQERLLVRFMVQGGLAKRGAVELKFEVPEHTASEIGVERVTSAESKEKDPFADDGETSAASAEEKRWELLPTSRLLVTGGYTAA